MKGTSIHTKGLYRVAALPTVLALLAVMAVAAAVSFFLVSSRYLRFALRPKSLPKTPMDWDTVPGRRMDFNSSARSDQQPVLDLQLTIVTTLQDKR